MADNCSLGVECEEVGIALLAVSSCQNSRLGLNSALVPQVPQVDIMLFGHKKAEEASLPDPHSTIVASQKNL